MFSVFRRAVRAVREWNQRRVAIMALSAMDDHQLSDIGIERGFLVDAVRGTAPHIQAARP